jgi:hypothetical protein
MPSPKKNIRACRIGKACLPHIVAHLYSVFSTINSKAKGMSTTLSREDCLLFGLITCKVGGWVIGKFSLLVFVVLTFRTL